METTDTCAQTKRKKFIFNRLYIIVIRDIMHLFLVPSVEPGY